MSAPSIVVIAKAPVPGRVKTRCCPPCTPAQAADLAAAALADTLDAVAGSAAARRVVALEGAPGPWLPAGFEVVAQCGGELGARIDHALAGAGSPAVLIGMDTPQVTAAGLDAALRAVIEGPSQAVVGPATDGGFWALGVATPVPGLCTSVPMSTASTADRLRDALRDRGVRWSELDELVDVDDVASAAAVAAGIPHSRFSATFDAIAATWQVA